MLLLLVPLLLLLAPPQILSAPRPRPVAQPAPFTPGLKIGALAGAALVIKALLLSNALSGEKEETGGHLSAEYGPPSSYGAPSYEPPPIISMLRLTLYSRKFQVIRSISALGGLSCNLKMSQHHITF